MENRSEAAWMRGGAAISLALSALAYAFRRRWLGRMALAFGLAFLERIRESRLAARVHDVLARSGRQG
jgi:hypothetical protein